MMRTFFDEHPYKTHVISRLKFLVSLEKSWFLQEDLQLLPPFHVTFCFDFFHTFFLICIRINKGSISSSVDRESGYLSVTFTVVK
jgi:hypothetical protein